MTTNETIDGLQEIIDRSQRAILPRVHIDYLIHAVKYLKEQKEEIENLKQTAQSMMEGICLLKEQEAVEPRISSVEQRCGNCNKVIEMDRWKACPWCGTPILWEAVGRSVKWG